MKWMHEHEYKTTKVQLDLRASTTNFGDRTNLQEIIVFRIAKKFGEAIDGAH